MRLLISSGYCSAAVVALAFAAGCSDDEAAGGAPAGDAGVDGAGDAGIPVAPLFGDRAPDETVEVDGIEARVEIARDEFGVPHIYGVTAEDVAFGQGYMHARDRLFQIDLYRHLVEGRLSEYFGDVTFMTDVQNRTNMMTTDGRMVYDVMAEQVPPELAPLLEAYAAGVNVYIAKVRAGEVPVPAGYSNSLLANWTPDLIPDWRPADTLAIGRLQEQNLSDSTQADMARGRALQALPANLFADLMRYQPPDPIAILPEFYDSPFFGGSLTCTSLSSCAIPPEPQPFSGKLYDGVDFEAARQRLALADAFGFHHVPEHVIGSNNWVIGGEHTASGNALVLNDPHLRFYNPPLFYHSHMDTRYYGGAGDDKNSLIGVSFGGIPGVLIGHNEHVAWGATTVGWDVSDVYVETVNPEGTQVLFEGNWVNIVEVPIEIRVFTPTATESRMHTVEMVPHHGAIVDGSKTGGTAMTRRWTGHEPHSSIQALQRRMLATNIDEFMEAMSQFVAGAQNWNGADVTGNTGYMPGARIPVRRSVTGACNPAMPVDGTGPCEWTGIIPANEVPRTKNRALGYVITANNDVTGTLADNDPTNDPQYLHSANADGFRARRITERVEELIVAGGGITRAQMVDLQGDTLSVEARRLMPFVFAARDADPATVSTLGLGPALDRLETWDFTTPSGVAAEYRTDGGPDAAEVEASIAAAIFFAFVPRFYAAAFDDEKTQYSVSFNSTTAALYLLENPTTSQTGLDLFDDPMTTTEVETPNDLILRSLRQGLDFLESQFGADMNAWRWGELHQVEVQDLFGEFGVSFRTLGPFPRGGANSTVDVASSAGGENYTYFAGPQMRFVAEVGPDGIVSASSLPGGQIDDPSSPHYDDLLPIWLRNETFPYYFKAEDVVAHTEELIVLVPPK